MLLPLAGVGNGAWEMLRPACGGQATLARQRSADRRGSGCCSKELLECWWISGVKLPVVQSRPSSGQCFLDWW